jgi:thiol-disulfide isomerase/thioredoxin
MPNPEAPASIRRRALFGFGFAFVWAGSLVGPAWSQGDALRAPEFELEGRHGRVGSHEFRGQWLYLDFWASWCAPCRLSFPWMNQMQARHGPRGLRIVAINLDAERASAERFLAEVPANFTVLFDSSGETPRRHAIKAMPTSWLIDPQGQLVWRHQGFRLEDRDDLEARLVAALGESSQLRSNR